MAEDVLLTDAFPSGVTPVSTPTAGCAIEAVTVTCDLGALAVGATGSITVIATVDDPGSFENTATASSSTPLRPISTLQASATVVADGRAAGGGGGGDGALPADWRHRTRRLAARPGRSSPWRAS